MKSLTILLLLFFVCLPVLSQENARTVSPEQTVRNFYSWYLHQLSRENYEPLKNRTVALKYLTPQFLNRVPRLEKEMQADAIVCAQDADPTWEQYFKVESPTINGSRATMHVQLDGRDAKNAKMKITVKRLTSGWRIDSVDCGQ